MRRLRLAYLSAGSMVHARPYLDYFVDQGHEVHWITYTQPVIPTRAIVHDLSSGVSPLGSSLAKWRYLTVVPRLRRLLHTLRPDLLHAHYVTAAGLLAGLAGHRPYVVSARGSDLIESMHSPLWRMLLRRIFASAAMVHTVSSQLAELAGQLGVPEGRLTVLTQGVDLAQLEYQPLADSRPLRLICTRHLRPVYDPAMVVRACGEVARRGHDLRVIFAGTGPLEEELKRLSSECGLGARAEFRGGYDNARIGELLRGSHIYVSSSQWDGTSISLLEAMACGTFPVVSRIDSNLDWVEHGRTALMFEPGDASGLADALEEAVRRPDLRQAAALVNRRTVEDRADRQRNMAALEQLYFRILDQGQLQVRR